MSEVSVILLKFIVISNFK